MNNTTLSVSLPKVYNYDLRGRSLTVTVNHNPFDLEPQVLFALALRQNQKRGFLFVSNVLGKHVPADPFIPLLAGAALALQFWQTVHGRMHPDTSAVIQALKSKRHTRAVYETLQSKAPIVLGEKTLFMGFAETATALGQSVFSLFAGAGYLHTTREQIPLLTSVLNFEETHSHAVQHCCYPLDQELLKTAETIVLIDDEITTGNTVLNLIREIQSKFPRTAYVVLSLLDWRNREDRAKYSALEEELKITIQTVSLLEGEIHMMSEWFDESPESRNDGSIGYGGKGESCSSLGQAVPEYRFLDGLDVVPVFSEDSLGYRNKVPYLKLTGRFGLSSMENRQMQRAAKRIGEELKNDRRGEKTLCLGTGEFMYFPMLIAAHMGEGTSYHSTTRSPIHPLAMPGYGIQNRFRYQSPDEGSILNYLYNIPFGHYNELYLFLEREFAPERLTSLLTVLHTLGIPRVVFVIASAALKG